MYKEILKDTIDTLNSMPVIIPDKGLIVGFTKEYIAPFNHFVENDNFHYPMGTTFLKYGINGIIDLAKNNKTKVKTEYGYELLDGIIQTYTEILNYFNKYLVKVNSLIENDDSIRLKKIKDSLEYLFQCLLHQ